MKITPQAAVANFIATFLLVALIITPIYFAKNFSQVAGVKTESRYLLISQTDKFPNMTFTQNSNIYQLSFTKQSQNQAYLSVFIINNPTQSPQKYTLKTQSPETNLFFGDDLNNLQNSAIAPPGSSIPISIITKSTSQSDLISFTIN